MSIKIGIKKFGAALVAAVTIALVTTPGQAVFTSISAPTFTASAVVGGGSTSMSIALLNVAGNTPATSIGWTGASSGGGWLTAAQYLQITSHMSQGNGAFIQTYTNNTGGTASPKYTGVISSSTVSPAGLVNSADTAAVPLPTAWQIANSTNPVAADDPNFTGTGHTGYAWFYHADKAQVANNSGVTGPFVNGASYSEVETAGVPANIQFAQGTFGAGAANGVNDMYIEANFLNAVGGTTYTTNTLTVELATP
jgi:hypothetical protein